ncbi:hypothetical protein GVO57_14180 (plasmid) [Sphingomonas changnyeongensis]|uniref:Uncharacterized protein n=1 Tax=Sphingomonas changnyeongensis TaxID=2698679 RepID=A0A7Z2NZ15_9SPHN|nr:hypothetical protein GVO57_14180 [Sphingomonas changnyeongensis]
MDHHFDLCLDAEPRAVSDVQPGDSASGIADICCDGGGERDGSEEACREINIGLNRAFVSTRESMTKAEGHG